MLLIKWYSSRQSFLRRSWQNEIEPTKMYQLLDVNLNVYHLRRWTRLGGCESMRLRRAGLFGPSVGNFAKGEGNSL